jgi:hypothetical protein
MYYLCGGHLMKMRKTATKNWRYEISNIKIYPTYFTYFCTFF